MENSVNKILKLLVGFSMSAWINAVLSFVLMPIITRLVLPEQLGKIDLFITFCSMFIYASTLGMHQAYMRFYNENLDGVDKSNLLALAIYLSSLGAIVAAGVSFLGYGYFSSSVLDENRIEIAFLMSAYIFLIGFLAIGRTKPRMTGDVKTYTLLVVVESFIVKLSYLSIVWTKDIIESLCFLVGASLVLALYCFSYVRNEIFTKVSSISKESLAIILKYALPTVPVMFISNVNTSLPKLILDRFCDTSVVGIYTSCLTLVSIITLIQAAVNVFWGPYVFENYKDKQEQIQMMHRVITFCMVFCGLGLLLFQDIVFYILGSGYRSSKVFYGLLLSSPVFYTIGETLGIGINIQKKTYLNIYIMGTTLLCNLCVGYLLVPHYGNVGAALAVMVSSLVMVLLKTLLGEKYYRVIATKSKTIIPIILYCTAAIISMLFVNVAFIRTASIVVLMTIMIVVYKAELKNAITLAIDVVKK